jgi:nucleoside-diphosphate-sugar epimerase
MRLLVLGGTHFLGRAIVDEARSRGYDVTTFSRGHSGHRRPGTEALTGDRTNPDDLRRLERDEWDGVIDTSVLAPAHVAASARILAGRTGHYTYISTLSVYAEYPRQPTTENSPVLDCPADATGTVDSLGYGQLKAGSERAVTAAFPGRCLIVRPGLIVGPHENVRWLSWWLQRLARGGTVLAPGGPDRPVRMTDVRDLAAWVVDNTRRRLPATVNVPGPQGATFGAMLAECVRLTSADGLPHAELRWAADHDLLEAGVTPWTALPMWAPDIPELAHIWEVPGDRALRTGMRYRPLSDTVHDTWLWLRHESARGQERAPHGLLELGIDPEQERAVLAGLR